MLIAWIVAIVVVAYFVLPRVLRALIKARLGGYVREANIVDPALGTRPESPKRVAVLGAGVAGLTSAVALARRGYAVTLIESKGHIGGKLGSWQVDLEQGEVVWVSHGFHAFFPHYHNLNRLLDSLGLRRDFASIEDYVIVGQGGQLIRFGRLDRTPLFNLVALARSGVFSLADALRAPGRDLYGIFLEYDHLGEPDRYDHLSFQEFNRLAKVPPRLKLAFDTFARAFFAEDDRLSLAELVKSFHFYYLSHDGGLVYQYPSHDYETAFLAPLRAELQRHGVTLRVNTRAQDLFHEHGTFRLNGETFDRVVVATDVVGARAIVTAATGLPAELVSRFSRLKPGQRYSVLRIWTDTDVRADIPVFVITDRVKALDALAVYHRLEVESADWVRRHGGAVLELHCYAVPDNMTTEEVKAALVLEMKQYFPELANARIHHEVFQIEQNFTAFHVGMVADRPGVDTGVPGLVCAGDWVKLPFPAMLLEAACASGLVAANALLRLDGLREERVLSVPLRGLMAGMPSPPARKVLDRPLAGP